MSDRKYRQRGYQENDREPQRQKPQSKPQGPQAPRDREGPRSPRMMAFGEAVKCSSCGVKAPSQISAETSCPNCKADLHTCRQCTYFDPSARFECTQNIPARVSPKDQANDCAHFTPRTSWERETTAAQTQNPQEPSGARKAFDDLFKF